jgi:hypothetical protein
MAERNGTTNAGAAIYSYDSPTDKTQVFQTLRRLVAEDAQARRTRQIFVISGTHGAADGTVTPDCADVSFKVEDLDSASITRTNINIRDYHQTAPNRWQELSNKGQNAVLVLAWCFSTQWLSNNTANGNNNSKIVMR